MDKIAMTAQIFDTILLLTFVTWFGYRYWWIRRNRAAMDAVMAAYRRGDYDGTLKSAEGLKRAGKNTRQYCFFRGAALLQLGKLDEAERWLRESLVLTTRDAMRARRKQDRAVIAKQGALTASTLGHLHLEKSAYDDALRCFGSSLRDWPKRGGSHRDIAEALLRRGVRPEDALRWAKLAVEEDRADEASEEIRRMNLSEDLATLAWAVAAASQNDTEVDKLVGEALPLTAEGPVPVSAQVHYHCGLAYATLHDSERSARYFGKAANLDPKGRWGRAATARIAGTKR